MINKLSEDTINKIINNAEEYANNISIKELVNLLKYFSDKYYGNGISEISDKDYDIMENILKIRDPKNKYLKVIRYQDNQEYNNIRTRLPYPMGSLTKIKGDNSKKEINKWTDKYIGPYILSDKLDGVSCQIYKDNNGNIYMYRGGGEEINGTNITNLIKYMKDEYFIKGIKSIPNGTSVRGELMISKNNFRNYFENNKNARNTVAGISNQKNIKKEQAKYLYFVSYEILNPRDQFKYYSDQLELLNKYGFRVVDYNIYDNINDEILSELFKNRRNQSIYDIDGIVIVDNTKNYEHKGGNPKYAFAYKTDLNDQQAIAEVIKVEWNISKDGFIKPRVKIQPIEIGGVIINYATGYNAKFIYDNKIGKGALVTIIRSGDVIPKIITVNRIANNNEPDMPTIDYSWTTTNVDIIVSDMENEEYMKNIIIKRLVYFFSTMDIKFISIGIIKKLIDYYDDIKSELDILNMDESELSEVLGKKISKKILKNIKECMGDLDIEVLMASSGVMGRGLAIKKINLVLDKYNLLYFFNKIEKINNIENINKDQIKNLQNKLKEKFKNKIKKNIIGYDDKTAILFAKGIIKFYYYFYKLNKIYNIEYLLNNNKNIIDQKNNINFEGQKIILTGFRDKDLEKKIKILGGDITTSVSKNTTLIISKDINSNSDKINKGKLLNINIISIDDFYKNYPQLKK